MDKIRIKIKISIALCCSLLLVLLLAVIFISDYGMKESSGLSSRDYSLYYSYKEDLKGVEVYCWKSDGAWYSGIISGKNKKNSINEIRWIQENLPCPLNEMKKILESYDDDKIGFVCIVDNPALDIDYAITADNKNEYIYVYDKLGIASHLNC